jgi:putative FmdB family regulatory protein
MPTYDYRCEACGPFAVMRPVADRDSTCACSKCGAVAQRMLSMPALSLIPSSGGGAERQLNQRAVYTHQHGAGCGCGPRTTSNAESAIA